MPHPSLSARPPYQRCWRSAKVVDPASGETTAHPELPDAVDPALVDWLGSEMDEELLELLHRYRARAKGYPPEQPRTDIDVEDREEFHLVPFDELFEGTRSDDFLLGGNRYWTCIFLCPYTDCDCHELRVAFFDDMAKPGSGDTVGSVFLDLGGTEGFEIVEVVAECEAPAHLIRELWALFGRRHRVAAFLRRREAQAKPGRNDPCPLRVWNEVQEVLPGQGFFDKHAMIGLPPQLQGRRRITETAAGPAALVVDDMLAPGGSKSRVIIELRRDGIHEVRGSIPPYLHVFTREFRFGPTLLSRPTSGGAAGAPDLGLA